jgi:hypothetical protein
VEVLTGSSCSSARPYAAILPLFLQMGGTFLPLVLLPTRRGRARTRLRWEFILKNLRSLARVAIGSTNPGKPG